MHFDLIFWLAAFAVFAVVEAATTALVSLWFAVGSLAALVVSLFGGSLGVQLAVFAVVSAVALGIMVPTLAKRRREQKAPVTNGAGLTLGKQGVVLKAILPGTVGRVRVDGLDWQAVADTPLPEGTAIVVTAAEGATLRVAAAAHVS